VRLRAGALRHPVVTVKLGPTRRDVVAPLPRVAEPRVGPADKQEGGQVGHKVSARLAGVHHERRVLQRVVADAALAQGGGAALGPAHGVRPSGGMPGREKEPVKAALIQHSLLHALRREHPPGANVDHVRRRETHVGEAVLIRLGWTTRHRPVVVEEDAVYARILH